MKLVSDGITIKGVPRRRLRVLDLNTPWVWFTIFYSPGRYGKPWLECSLWSPNSWKRFWLNVWQWEDVPDEHGKFSMPAPPETVLA